MRRRGVVLADHGFTADPGRIELTDSTVVFYHYTREERAEAASRRASPSSWRLPVSKVTTSSRRCWSRCRCG